MSAHVFEDRTFNAVLQLVLLARLGAVFRRLRQDGIDRIGNRYHPSQARALLGIPGLAARPW